MATAFSNNPYGSPSSAMWYTFTTAASPPVWAALATMATSTLKVAASALNSSMTTAGGGGGMTLAHEQQHYSQPHSHLHSPGSAATTTTNQQQQQHHPYQPHTFAGNNSNLPFSRGPLTGSGSIIGVGGNNTTTTSTSLSYHNASNLTSFLLPTHLNNNGSYMGDGGLVDSNTFLTSTGSVVGSGNNSFVDGFMVDHLPLQLITSTTPKVNLDIEIDIQLLTSDYDGGTTITTYFNETSWINPSETDTIVGIFLSVLIFLSIAGNILVCLAIYTERSLRRIGNLFLASLAIADLFVASLVMTFAGVNDLLGYWIFGAQFCDTWVAFDVMCSTASILNLCAISLDRYIHIKDPLRYGRWVTRRVAVITIAAIWLLAAFVSFVPISLGLHRPDQPLIVEDNGKKYPTCALDLTPTYAVVSSCISFYFPCVVMIGIYCRLYCYAQKHVKSIKAVTRPGEVAEKQRYKSIRRTKPPEKKKFKVRNLNHSSPYHVSDHKAAVTVGVIMGVFLICWVPFFCVNIVAAFCKTCIGGQTFKILSWLGYSNSAFNPIIYSIFNKEFRDAFKRILTTRNPWCCNQDIGNIHPRNSDRFVTDYAAKHVVAMNSGRSSAELEQVSAI
ncbi:dopamine receptor 1 isoform X2 [Musca domestica]|uniref:Dopamine receptor 1 isoform X2 n=2 Tax=Musca domestica TaxID=7370 RepID=A0ABM3UWA7_MUSDO|nr:dopamine receptor 1 isoform X2 [Musca domestica]